MSNDQPGAVPPGGKPKRRPPTIDLTATEIETPPGTSTTPEQTTRPEEAPPTAPPEAEAQPAPQQLEPGAAPDAGLSPETVAAEAPPRTETEAPQATAHTQTAAPEPATEPATDNAATRGRMLVGASLFGGGVIIALLFALAALWFQQVAGVEDARITRIEQQLRELAARPATGGGDGRALEELRTRLTQVESAVANPRPATLDPTIANRIAAIEGEVKAIHEQVGVALRRSDEAVATAREARARAEATAAALAELTQKLERPGSPVVQRNELEALAGRVAAVERAAKTLESEVAKRAAEGSDRTGRLAVAASALNAAVERGAPFASELAMVKALAPDPKVLAPLEPFAATGVPAAAALARELAGLGPALQQAAGTTARDGGGFLERLQANAERIVRIRPLGETTGADPAAIVARVEFKAMHADIAGALTELAALPPAVRAPAEEWIKKAQARAAAIEASRKLVADALAGLSK